MHDNLLRDVSQVSSTAISDGELGELSHAAEPKVRVISELCKRWLSPIVAWSNLMSQWRGQSTLPWGQADSHHHHQKAEKLHVNTTANSWSLKGTTVNKLNNCIMVQQLQLSWGKFLERERGAQYAGDSYSRQQWEPYHVCSVYSYDILCSAAIVSREMQPRGVQGYPYCIALHLMSKWYVHVDQRTCTCRGWSAEHAYTPHVWLKN